MSKSAAAKAAKIEPQTAPPATVVPAPANADVKPALKHAAPLLVSEVWPRESGIRFNTWECVPRAGITLEQILRAEFWGNVSQRMKSGDTVIVFPRDGAFYAELVVWDAGQNWAHVSPRSHLERPAFEKVAGVDSDFEIVNDPIDGVTVRRKSTGEKLKGNLPNHEDARRWLLDYQKALRT